MPIGLRARGYDAVHAGEIGLHRAKDTQILALAKQEGRIVITADLDFPRLLALSRAEDPGLILIRGGDWSDIEVIERIRRVLNKTAPAKLKGGILTIARDRVRWRSLPVDR